MITKIKNLIRANLVSPILQTNSKFKNFLPNKVYSFGSKNIMKKFYVIKRNFNATGMFSNVTFVVDHINYALKLKKIPIIDMENYPTVYNEKKFIKNKKNSWDYYFEAISNYKLKDVYNSSNVCFSKDIRTNNSLINKDEELKKIFKKYIKIRKNIKKKFFKIKKKYFKKKDKIICVHVRGTIQRIVRGHSLPPHPKDILTESINLFNQYHCTKLFLITEDIMYLNIFKRYFKKKMIFLNVPRSNPKFYNDHNEHFSNYNRKNHRYLLGEEAIIDCLILSEVPIKLYTDSNVWRISNILSKKKQKKIQIITSKNSKNKLIARWKWYIKYYFGKIEYKIIEHK